MILSTAVKPVEGQLIHLRTKAELQPKFDQIEVYIVRVPKRYSGHVLNFIKLAPEDSSVDLRHLRRVAKKGFLPTWLEALEDQNASQNSTYSTTKSRRPSSISSRSSTASRSSGKSRSRSPQNPSYTYTLVAPTSLVERQALLSRLQSDTGLPYVAIYTTQVSRLPPTTLEEAKRLSETSWPTIFNPNSSYGPTPAQVNSAQQIIADRAGYFIALATAAAAQSSAKGLGPACGVTIVERPSGQDGQVICVAGDTRWTSIGAAVGSLQTGTNGSRKCAYDGTGDPACHAVMRSIAMVAEQRRWAARSSTSPTSLALAAIPSGSVSTLEDELHSSVTKTARVQQNGYLCLNMELYATHEPCVMCCMAIVHSRFSKVVFATRMPATGGLTAELSGKEHGLGYGVFWHPVLNWRFFCWEFLEKDGLSESPRSIEQLATKTHV